MPMIAVLTYPDGSVRRIPLAEALAQAKETTIIEDATHLTIEPE